MGQLHLYACVCGDTLCCIGNRVLDCCRAKGHVDHRPRNWANEPVERSLVDDLADVLIKTVVGWEPIIGHDLAEAPEVKRVLARYHQEVTGDG